MAKKQTTKTRTQAKDLPRKEKKMTTANLKKVKGGIGGSSSEQPTENISLNYTKVK